VVTIGQTARFWALMMMLRAENKRAAGWMSRAASSYNGGETWKLYWLFSWCCFCSVAEAGDILAGEYNVRWCFANGPNKNLAVWSDVNSPFIPEAHAANRSLACTVEPAEYPGASSRR